MARVSDWRSTKDGSVVITDYSGIFMAFCNLKGGNSHQRLTAYFCQYWSSHCSCILLSMKLPRGKVTVDSDGLSEIHQNQGVCF